jgi:DnaJ-class molecular chaperone
MTRYAEPPINPPEVRLSECRDCGGTGQTVDHDGPLGPLVARVQWCYTCDGSGETEPDPDAGGYDTVKEAEGIA